MPYVSVAGVDIYYETHGSGEPILFAHGAGGNAAIWFEQVAALSESYQCIAFDHRTFARSPADPASISPVQFRDDALAILDALEPKTKREEARGPALSPSMEKLLGKVEKRTLQISKLGKRLEKIQQSKPETSET